MYRGGRGEEEDSAAKGIYVSCEIRCGQNRFTHLPEDDSVHARYYMHVIISTCNLLISSYIQGSIYMFALFISTSKMIGMASD